MSTYATARLHWIDHLRTAVIILVVNIHACVTYSHVGDWYTMAAYDPPLAVKIPFFIWEMSLQSFFMGLLFFLAGYFAQRSIARRGPIAFLKERCFRLGLPALLYVIVIHPLMILALYPKLQSTAAFFPWYGKFFTAGRFLRATGPLWFAVALLAFCVVFAVWRAFRPAPSAQSETAPAPAPLKLWLFAAGIAVASFLVRLAQPIGTNFYNMQLCFFAQYVAAFIAGVAAARQGWLPALARSRSTARIGMWAPLVATIVVVILLWAGLVEHDAFTGGWRWQAVASAFWEQFSGLAYSLGLLALFSRRFDRETPRWRWLSDRAFAVYVLHAPVLVALTLAFRSLPPNPFFLAALLTVTGLVGSFVLADLVKRIPGLRSFL